jgi:transposase
LLLDRVQQHYRSKKVRAYLQEKNDVIRVEYLAKGSPEFNALEEGMLETGKT